MKTGRQGDLELLIISHRMGMQTRIAELFPCIQVFLDKGTILDESSEPILNPGLTQLAKEPVRSIGEGFVKLFPM